VYVLFVFIDDDDDGQDGDEDDATSVSGGVWRCITNRDYMDSLAAMRNVILKSSFEGLRGSNNFHDSSQDEVNGNKSTVLVLVVFLYRIVMIEFCTYNFLVH